MFTHRILLATTLFLIAFPALADSPSDCNNGNCVTDKHYTGPVEPYIYGYDYGPSWHYPHEQFYFGPGYYHDDYYGGFTPNGNYYHSGTYEHDHGNGNYPKP
ncbi:MAG: hypothetical protein ABSF18_00255 [Gammaproteobacteria bacterium]|jgi:hypothetical protein